MAHAKKSLKRSAGHGRWGMVLRVSNDNGGADRASALPTKKQKGLAAVVALETAKLRGLYTPLEAAELLGEIGEQVDARAGRVDRIVSDLVFLMLGRIEMGAGMERMKAPYDKAVKTVLQQMGVTR